MPLSTVAAVRAQIAKRRPDPVYLVVGDDDAEMVRVSSDIAGIVEDDLRAFNLERLYASDREVTAQSIAEAARQLPMMTSHRVVIVLRAERLLKPKRKAKDGEAAEEDAGPSGGSSDALEAYLRAPEASTVLVFVASDVDRTRRLYKQLQKTATIVECWGLKQGKDARGDLRQVARQAEQLVRSTVSEAGQQIEPAAARLLAERAGTDIAQLRGDVERLMLYAAGKPKITLADAREVVTAASSQDDWAVTNAIRDGDPGRALRELGLSLESGAVPFMVLGQLGYFVREKLPALDPGRVRGAVEALFRTDIDLKSSGGDPRVLLERLVTELCGERRSLKG
jgi:DNA polymerase-3 subunit delta